MHSLIEIKREDNYTCIYMLITVYTRLSISFIPWTYRDNWMDLPRSGISLSEHCRYTAFSVTPCFYLASHTGGSKILHRPLRCLGRHQDHWPHPRGISQLENSNRFYIFIIPRIPFIHIYLLGGNSKTLPKRIEYGSVLSHICIKVINFDIWYISLHFR